MNLSPNRRTYLPLVFLINFVILVTLAYSTYYINYWPTDSENPYIPTAAKLFNLPYLSAMHYVSELQMFQLTMRGKEALILGIAAMQRLLHDDQSLYPNVLLLIIAINISSILIFFIVKKLFDKDVGFLAFLLFTFCFWPYMYILQGAHPPFVLMNFLLAIIFLQYGNKLPLFYLLSGIFLGLMLFSSPTSPLYLPYYLGFLIYVFCFGPIKTTIESALKNLRSIFFGGLCIFMIFTYPHPIFNVKEYLRFLTMSQHANNFYIYRTYLAHWFVLPPSLRGGGEAWIIKYFFLIMPVMFSVYLFCLLYACLKIKEKPFMFLVAFLSLSSPIFVEISRVAQFGRNYFSWFIGMIFFIALCTFEFQKGLKEKQKIPFRHFVIVIIAGHIIFNLSVFFQDIFPSRMATTNIYNWLIKHRTMEIASYPYHPRFKNMIEFLNNQKFVNHVYFWPIKTIKDVKTGYILIPTLTGKTIWCECREQDFSLDPELNALFRSDEFPKYVVATFKTLSSSKIWTQEEEICTYRDLILGDISRDDRYKGLAFILDAQKLQKDWFSKNTPKNGGHSDGNELK